MKQFSVMIILRHFIGMKKVEKTIEILWRQPDAPPQLLKAWEVSAETRE